MDETVAFQGKIFDIVQTTKADGRVFEVARRAPGVRLIIADTKVRKVLLSREFRHELQTYDFRLPGGKVFETAAEYETFRNAKGELIARVEQQAKIEAAEEAGIDIADLKLFKKSTLGATVEWDLYVFEATHWQPHVEGQQLQEDELQDIVGADFYDYEQVKAMIVRGELQEERVALILLQWIETQL